MPPVVSRDVHVNVGSQELELQGISLDECLLAERDVRDPLAADRCQSLGPRTRVRHGRPHVGLSTFSCSIDAVDFSQEMIAEAKQRSIANVRWIVGPAETFTGGRYDLIVAGESLHWMDWPQLFPRIASMLASNAMLAIVERRYARTEWWTDDFQQIIDRFTTNREYQKYDFIAELEGRGLFAVDGSCRTTPVSFAQPLEDLVEAFHSRNGFSRDRMTVDAARGFDVEASSHLARFAEAGVMSLGVEATVTWGRVTAA
jgi:SAM-dependent methyltransferase